MADITPEQAALLQIRLANEHRLTLQQIATLTIADMTTLFRALEHEDDDTFKRAIRQTVPKIIDAYSPNAVVVAADYYQKARTLLDLSGQLSKKAQAFSPNPTAFMTSNIPIRLANDVVDNSFYHLTNALDAGNRQAAIEPIKALAEKDIFETSRQLITVSMEEDKAADDSPRRQVRDGGCPFCKTMAMKVGVDAKWENKFHPGCSCVAGPAFKNEVVSRPEWADKYEADYDKARRDIMDYNASLTLKKEFVDGRYISVYYDADGNKAKPLSITTKNIVNGMRRMDYKSGQ